ncbi:staphylopine uptake ABC transporter ATP-binding protein CntF [Paenibacillus silvae]|uniref:staphylopine uptake ABC transporter ATP-binding protein CntF n=1 Tax=Paenibacillus TaxID=44249 RepID=UPI001C11FB13|nr:MULTISPECIES: ABC transporter ATP-binding protein [Paenibacillus]MBU5354778.1 ABC transporter ATP-binding protein [Paenibacillus barcinonensis]MDM5275896.1 ABC transporter ATP-binding protein [Paenibacillus silvae]
MNIVEVKHLKVWDTQTDRTIIHDSSFEVRQGSCLAIVGESGSGKSVTCRALMRLNKPNMRQSGTMLFQGEDLQLLPEQEMRRRRGRHLCMIMQQGMSAFDPSCVLGVHIRETLQTHYNWNTRELERKMHQAMEQVMLKNPKDILNQYPHQLSGGMLQRMMIALALVLEPELIIADEPTTALDTISQYEVLEQLIQLRERIGCSMIFISHDLGVVRKVADDVMVMKDGSIVEQGSIQSVLQEPAHAYTRYLVSTRQELSDHFKAIMQEGS